MHYKFELFNSNIFNRHIAHLFLLKILLKFWQFEVKNVIVILKADSKL